MLDLPDWPGHRPGQHVDVRLTAEDGYQAQRSYSIASAPENRQLVLTIERLEEGKVSPYSSLAAVDDADIHLTLTREWPDDWQGHRGRAGRQLLEQVAWAPGERPLV